MYDGMKLWLSRLVYEKWVQKVIEHWHQMTVELFPVNLLGKESECDLIYCKHKLRERLPVSSVISQLHQIKVTGCDTQEKKEERKWVKDDMNWGNVTVYCSNA